METSKNLRRIARIVLPSEKVRFIIRNGLYYLIEKVLLYFYLPLSKACYKKKQKNLINKNKINIVFLVPSISLWKSEEIYKRLINDDKYKVFIVVVPVKSWGKDYMHSELDRTFNYFKNKYDNVFNSYDSKKQNWLSIRKIINPDIVFFSYPHYKTKWRYYIYYWCTKTLTCYIPYGIINARMQKEQFNLNFHNLIWRNFYETDIHLNMAKKYAFNKGKNVLVTGYSACDIFLDNNYNAKDVWKLRDKEIKRIIWAPHHIHF